MAQECSSILLEEDLLIPFDYDLFERLYFEFIVFFLIINPCTNFSIVFDQFITPPPPNHPG